MSALALRTEDIARHELGHAVCAVAQGWGVGRLTIVPDGNVGGSCQIMAPQGRSSYQLAIEEITIRLAGRVACQVGDDSADVALALEVARRAVSNDYEGQCLIDYCIARAASLIEKADRIGLIDKFVALLEERGGVHDFRHEPIRDIKPLIEVQTAPITVNMPPPIINITTPGVTVENQIDVQSPDKTISFFRDTDGQIIEAESTTAPVAA
jgi:hypothetical protein